MTTAPKFIAVTCVFVVALAMVLSVYYLLQKRHPSRHMHDGHDPLPPGEVAIRHGHGRDGGCSWMLYETFGDIQGAVSISGMAFSVPLE